MEPYIKTPEDLYSWLTSLNRLSKYHLMKHLEEGIYVDTKIRRQVLASVDQGKWLFKGTPCHIIFENMSGGVWRASLDYRVTLGE